MASGAMVKRVVDLTAEDLDTLARDAWSREVKASLDKGLPVTFAGNGHVVRAWPDGRRETDKSVGARTKGGRRRKRASA